MNRIFTAAAFGLMTSLATAQTSVDISGRVVTPHGKPVGGIIVRCTSQNLADTTGADGKYSLLRLVTSADKAALIGSPARPRLENGRVLFAVAGKAARVQVSVYSVRGQLVGSAFGGMAEPGSYAAPLLAALPHGTSRGLYLVRVCINGENTVMRLLCTRDLPSTSAAPVLQKLFTSSLAKNAAGSVEFVNAGKLLSQVSVNLNGTPLVLPDMRINRVQVLGSLLAGNPVPTLLKGITSVQRAHTGYTAPVFFPDTVLCSLVTSTRTITAQLYYAYSDSLDSCSITLNAYAPAFCGQSAATPFIADTDTVRIAGFAPGNRLPVITLGPDTTVSINDRINLKGVSNDSLGAIDTIQWKIGGNSWVRSSKLDTAVFAPAAPASRFVCLLRIVDKSGNLSFDSLVAAVVLDPPVVNAGPDTTVSIKDTVRLHGAATDAYGTIAKYEWDIGASGTFVTARKDTVIIAPSAANATYRCILRATDDDGNQTHDTMIVHVLLDPPVAVLLTPDSVIIDSQFTIRTGASTPGSYGTIASKAVSIGSYNTFITLGSADTICRAPSLVADSFAIVLRVTDDDGNSAYDTSLIRIVNWWKTGDLTRFEWRDAIVYHIMVDRFMNGDPANDGPFISGVDSAANYLGGDLAGIMQKVQAGYFDDLGVNTILLSPVNDNPDQSGLRTDGHLTSAYEGAWLLGNKTIESHFGDSAALAGLIAETHNHSLKILSCYMPKHVHSSAPVFTQHADWFNPAGICGTTVAWEACTSGCYMDYLPSFNYTNATARTWSVNLAVDYAKQFGFDGYYVFSMKDTHKSWFSAFRTAAKTGLTSSSAGLPFLALGEMISTDRNEMKFWIDPDVRCDGLIDWPLGQKANDAFFQKTAPMSDLAAFVETNDTMYGIGTPVLTTVGPPGFPRVIHRAEGGHDFFWQTSGWTPTDFSQPGTVYPFERLALAYAFLFTSPGVPYILYGDEIGLPGGSPPDAHRMIQWSNNSANQNQLRSTVSRLASIRSNNKALTRGYRTSISVATDTWVYKMGGLAGKGPDIYVALNRTDSPQSIAIPAGSYENLMTGATASGGSLSVAARGFLILKPQ